jgi:hypothetical protein
MSIQLIGLSLQEDQANIEFASIDDALEGLPVDVEYEEVEYEAREECQEDPVNGQGLVGVGGFRRSITNWFQSILLIHDVCRFARYSWLTHGAPGDLRRLPPRLPTECVGWLVLRSRVITVAVGVFSSNA